MTYFVVKKNLRMNLEVLDWDLTISKVTAILVSIDENILYIVDVYKTLVFFPCHKLFL